VPFLTASAPIVAADEGGGGSGDSGSGGGNSRTGKKGILKAGTGGVSGAAATAANSHDSAMPQSFEVGNAHGNADAAAGMTLALPPVRSHTRKQTRRQDTHAENNTACPLVVAVCDRGDNFNEHLTSPSSPLVLFW